MPVVEIYLLKNMNRNPSNSLENGRKFAMPRGMAQHGGNGSSSSLREVSFIPSSLPSVDDASIFAQITEFDATACCAQEHRNRKSVFRCAIIELISQKLLQV